MKKKSDYVLEIIRLDEFSDNSAVFDAGLVGVTDKTVAAIRRKKKELGLNYADAKAMGLKKLGLLFDAKRRRKKDKVMPDWTLVHKAMQMHKHATLIQLHHEYKLMHGKNAYAYSQFTHYYREFIKKIDLSMRQTHHPGEQIFIDFAGKPIHYLDEQTGERKKAYIFVGVLGFSQYTFAYACEGQTAEDWVQACIEMYKFFNGVTQSLVPDNPKAVVLKSGKDLVLNPTFQDMAQHYGTFVIPARVRKPQDKSLAEIGVLIVTRWITVPLNRRKYFSIDEINRDIPELLTFINNRKFKRLPGTRYERFVESDKPQLIQHPAKPYRRLRFVSDQKVDPTYHIYIDGHAYSVPFTLVGERVSAWVGYKIVELIHDGLRVAIHKRSKVQGEHTTNPKHCPPSHAAFADLNKDVYLSWAKGIGEFAGKAIESQFINKPSYSSVALKACEKLKDLAKKYGEERFENACKRADKEASLTAKSIASILRSRLDLYDPEEYSNIFVTNHENLRGSQYY
ncbi:MAG: IS21 family transposase [Gammaproteobacteria bacterium]|nr:IS21 family transposase [Gammaproteobacteria bacterium]